MTVHRAPRFAQFLLMVICTRFLPTDGGNLTNGTFSGCPSCRRHPWRQDGTGNFCFCRRITLHWPMARSGIAVGLTTVLSGRDRLRDSDIFRYHDVMCKDMVRRY